MAKLEHMRLSVFRSPNWTLAEQVWPLPGESRWSLSMPDNPQEFTFEGRSLEELAEIIDAWRYDRIRECK